MVEQADASRRTGPRNVDWIAVYDGWSRGDSAEHLAARFGMQVKTVSLRCGWIDQHFPPGAPVRLIDSFAQVLDEAHALLESGEAVQAERRAKALSALVRAARALEDWTMDKRKPAGGVKPGAAEHEESGDDDPRAELERRLRNLLHFERKRRAERSAAERGGGQAGLELGDEDPSGPHTPLGGLGET
jgi:hypothetical protein